MPKLQNEITVQSAMGGLLDDGLIKIELYIGKAQNFNVSKYLCQKFKPILSFWA